MEEKNLNITGGEIIFPEDLEKVSGGGDYDFIHYNDGLNCPHRPGTIIARHSKGRKYLVEMICKFCGKKVYFYQIDGDQIYFVTEKRFRYELRK